MDKSEYRRKQEAAERKRQESEQRTYRDEVIGALKGISEQNKAADNQANRTDRFHRLVEKLTLRLDGRKYWLELAETIGLWVAAGVGVAAILISSHDSEVQTKVMQAQLTAMQGQLTEMKGTGAQTDQMIEANRKLAEAAGKQAQAAIDSAKTAQDNMVASQRAWVGPSNAKTAKAPELDTETSVVIEYQNTGREPGREAIYDAEVFTAAAADDAESVKRINSFIGQCKIKWTPTQATVVYPSTGGFGGAAYNLTKVIPASLIDQEVVDGAKSIFVNGCIVYKTVGGIHRSSFCYYFTSKQTPIANWNICQVGNDAD